MFLRAEGLKVIRVEGHAIAGSAVECPSTFQTLSLSNLNPLVGNFGLFFSLPKSI